MSVHRNTPAVHSNERGPTMSRNVIRSILAMIASAILFTCAAPALEFKRLPTEKNTVWFMAASEDGRFLITTQQ